MNAVCERRSDGIWYYLEVRPTESDKVVEEAKPVVEEPVDKSNDEDLPF